MSAVDAIKKTLLLASSNQETKLRSIGALLNLCADESKHEEVRNSGLIEILVETLKSMKGNQNGELRTAGCLLNLCVQEESRKLIVEQGALELLVSLLQSQYPNVAQYAAGAVNNLSADDENKPKIFELGAVKPLVELAKSNDETTKEYALSALCTLSSYEPVADELVPLSSFFVGILESAYENGAAESLQRTIGLFWNLCVCASNSEKGREALRAISPDLVSTVAQLLPNSADLGEDVMSGCAIILAILSSDPQNLEQVRKTGAVTTIVEFLSAVEDSDVLQNICTAVWNFAQDAQMRNEMKSLQVESPLMTILDSQVLETMEKCTGAILTLCLDDEYVAKFRGMGIIEKIVPYLGCGEKELMINIIVIIGMLSFDEKARGEVLESGAVSQLIEMLSTHLSDEEMIEKICAALLNLSQDKTIRTAVRQLDGIKPLIDLLDHDNAQIQHNAAGALWNLSVDPSNKTLIRKFGGLTKLLSVMSGGKKGTKKSANKKEQQEKAAKKKQEEEEQKKKEEQQEEEEEEEEDKPAKVGPPKRSKSKIGDSDDEESDDEGDKKPKKTQTGPPKRKPATKLADDDDEDESDKKQVTKTGPPQRKAANKIADSDDEEDEPKKSATGPPKRSSKLKSFDSDSDEEPAPAKKTVGPPKRSGASKIDDDEDDEEEKPIKARGPPRRGAVSKMEESDDEETAKEFDEFQKKNPIIKQSRDSMLVKK